jgi:hypothetical protein
MSKTIKWEYYRELISYGVLVSRMNEIGENGWEAFAILESPGAAEVYFKKPVQFLKTSKPQLLNE